MLIPAHYHASVLPAQTESGIMTLGKIMKSYIGLCSFESFSAFGQPVMHYIHCGKK
jgi:hypothetical protein